MENNQSKVIEIIIPLTLFFITIFSIFIFSKNNEVKKDIFVYDDIKEEKNNEVFIEVEISSKEEIKKVCEGFKEINNRCIKGTNCSLFVKIMIKVVIFNVLALIF